MANESMAHGAYKLEKKKGVQHLQRGNIEISEKKKHVEDLGHDVRHGYRKIIAAVRLSGLAPARPTSKYIACNQALSSWIRG